MNWENIAGHDAVVTMLKNMLETGKVPHALLFSGPAGIGKMPAARVFAAGLLCSGPAAGKPCGECSDCAQAARQSHPDLVVLAGDGGSIKIEQIRALQHEAAFAPYNGRRRVFIVEDAGRLTAQAANSLLKILEEPAPGTVFVLTATSGHALLPTIVSRCRVLSFRPLDEATLTGFLLAGGVGPERAVLAARLSGGRVGQARSFLAPGGLALRDRAAELAAALPAGEPAMALELAAGLDKMEDSDLRSLLIHLAQILRDVLATLIGQGKLVFNTDLADTLASMAAAWDEERLLGAQRQVQDTLRALETNANTRLTCEALMIKLIGVAKEGKGFADSCRNPV